MIQTQKNRNSCFGNRNMSWTNITFFFGFILGLSLQTCLSQQEPQDPVEITTPADFSPSVTATCRGETMTIIISTNSPFYGAIHPRTIRNSQCSAYGSGSNATTLKLNMLAQIGDPDYCGITYSNRSEERSLQLAVRPHRTLELAEDKLYVVTCGKSGFRNSRNNETWSVKLGFYNGNNHVSEVFTGRSYQVRVELSKAPEFSIRVRSCFSFEGNNYVALVDDNGCPEKGVISKWTYSKNNQMAEATIYSMFRFADSKRLNFQCNVLLCQDKNCLNPNCENSPSTLTAIPQRQRDTNDTSVLATTTVSVLEPGDKPETEQFEEDCTGVCRYYNLLFWLAIIFGILFLIMILVNCFLCSALTCTCTRTELVEKEPSVLEDYDPYRSWAGSQYGDSRYSINGKPVYSVSAESGGGSDHYATVPSRHSPSRPNSRYSNGQGGGHRIGSRGPPSNSGSPYTHNRKL